MLLPACVFTIAQPPLNSLAAVLARLYWNAAARGPLLIVAPELYTPLQKPDEAPPDLFRHDESDTHEDGEPEDKPEPLKLPAGLLNPTVLLPHFGLQITRLEGLSVVTHPRMQVPHALSLTESPWQAIGSAQGLLIRIRAADKVPHDSRSEASEALWKLGEKRSPSSPPRSRCA